MYFVQAYLTMFNHKMEMAGSPVSKTYKSDIWESQMFEDAKIAKIPAVGYLFCMSSVCWQHFG